MIQAASEICWVRATDGRAEPFEDSRLAATLARAARRAGWADPWWVDNVVAAVRMALRDGFDRQIVDVAELVVLVERVLVVLGYHEVAALYRRRREYAEIDLREILPRAEPVTELEFFHHLDAALRKAIDGQLMAMNVSGLRVSVMRLLGARYWSERCRQLSAEVVEHIRARVAQARCQHALALRLVICESS